MVSEVVTDAWRKLKEGRREELGEEELAILDQEIRNDLIKVTFQPKTDVPGGKPHRYLGEDHFGETYRHQHSGVGASPASVRRNTKEHSVVGLK